MHLPFTLHSIVLPPDARLKCRVGSEKMVRLGKISSVCLEIDSFDLFVILCQHFLIFYLFFFEIVDYYKGRSEEIVVNPFDRMLLLD